MHRHGSSSDSTVGLSPRIEIGVCVNTFRLSLPQALMCTLLGAHVDVVSIQLIAPCLAGARVNTFRLSLTQALMCTLLVLMSTRCFD
jgi:hypothetical protein